MKQYLLPYQKAWLEDSSPIKLMEKSRQIGISWTTAYGLVYKHAQERYTETSWITSRDRFQAQLFLEDCKQFTHGLNLISQKINALLLDPKKKPSKNSLYFANGSSIHALSSSPDAQAGKRGTRILDEFALHPEAYTLFITALPGTTWQGSLHIISTHRGQNNFFNQLIQEARHNGNPHNISLHKVTLEDALNQGFLKKLQSVLPKDDFRQSLNNAQYFDFVKNSCPDEESFLQEYMCQPLDDQSGFIPYKLILANEYPDTDWEYSLPLPSNKELYLGIDIARKNDLTVFWILEKINHHYFTRLVISLKDTPFNEQFKILDSIMRSSSIKRCCIDHTGLGRQFAEQATQKFGSGRIESIHFSNTIKETLAYPVKTILETKQLSLPSNNTIRNDLHAIKKEITSSGNIRFMADNSQNGHADHFWALALALHAAQSKTHYFYQKIKKN